MMRPKTRDLKPRRVLTIVLTTVAVFFLLVATLVGCSQRKLIYFPEPYGPGHRSLMVGVESIEYETSQGSQTSFYLPPRSGEAPDTLWIVFNGNATIALTWNMFLAQFPDDSTGFLLFDYPGYGFCEGKPTRASIAEAADAAQVALAAHLGRDPEDLAPTVGHWGVSLGTAVALEHSVRHPPDKILLVAPFTRLMDMARATIGWPLCHLLLDRYDSVARLEELAALPQRPALTIMHGDADEVIPVRMGRELGGLHPDWINYIEVPGAGHNDIVDKAWSDIESELRELGPDFP